MPETALLGLLVFLALLGGQVLAKLRLPMVMGYLLVGIAIGPSALGIISGSTVESFHIAETLGLGFIAFTIGLEFRGSEVATLGKQISVITISQLTVTAIVVIALTWLVSNSFPLALLFGVIATATAPAEIVMVIRELQAKGPLTKTVLGIVALDDAFGIILFALTLPIAKLLSMGAGFSFGTVLFNPLREIFGSILLGLFIGYVLSKALKYSPGHGWALSSSLVLVFLATALSDYFHLSALLSNMALGATVINLYPYASNICEDHDEVVNIVYVVFFCMAGASFNLEVLPSVGLIGAGYVIARIIGKMLGSYLGTVLTGSPSSVRRYLGLALLPQAGVALGLVTIAAREIPIYQTPLTTVILASTLFFSLSGAPLASFAISQAGERRRDPDKPLWKREVK